MTAILFVTIGGLTGVVHALALARAAAGRARPLSAPLRLLAVAGVLLAAALTGHLLAAASGWAAAFATAAIVLSRRRS